MIRLRQEVGLTVSIATTLEDRSGVIVVDVEAGGGNVLYTLKLGAIFDFHSSAHGKTALAFGDKALLDLTIARGLRRVAPRTIVSADALRREIKKIRETGWAAAAEEAEANMNALVAPIFSSRGICEGSIGIFGPLELMGREPSPALVRSVMSAARRVSARLGGAQAAMRRR
jgi:DNA-binding IclR family transcriptional regulator